MKEAKLSVVRFDESDVISTSVLKLTNVYNGTTKDDVYNINGKEYRLTTLDQIDEYRDAFNKVFGNDAAAMELFNNGTSIVSDVTMNAMISADLGLGSNQPGEWNGFLWMWDATNHWFTKVNQ